MGQNQSHGEHLSKHCCCCWVKVWKPWKLCLEVGKALDAGSEHTPQQGETVEGNRDSWFEFGVFFPVFLLAAVQAGALQPLLHSPKSLAPQCNKNKPQEGKELAGKGKAAVGTGTQAQNKPAGCCWGCKQERLHLPLWGRTVSLGVKSWPFGFIATGEQGCKGLE